MSINVNNSRPISFKTTMYNRFIEYIKTIKYEKIIIHAFSVSFLFYTVYTMSDYDNFEHNVSGTDC